MVTRRDRLLASVGRGLAPLALPYSRPVTPIVAHAPDPTSCTTCAGKGYIGEPREIFPGQEIGSRVNSRRHFEVERCPTCKGRGGLYPTITPTMQHTLDTHERLKREGWVK